MSQFYQQSRLIMLGFTCSRYKERRVPGRGHRGWSTRDTEDFQCYSLPTFSAADPLRIIAKCCTPKCSWQTRPHHAGEDQIEPPAPSGAISLVNAIIPAVLDSIQLSHRLTFATCKPLVLTLVWHNYRLLRSRPSLSFGATKSNKNSRYQI